MSGVPGYALSETQRLALAMLRAHGGEGVIHAGRPAPPAVYDGEVWIHWGTAAVLVREGLAERCEDVIRLRPEGEASGESAAERTHDA